MSWFERELKRLLWQVEPTKSVWDDLRIEPIARTTGANAPSFVQWRTDGAGSRGAYAYVFDDAVAGSEKEVFFTMQMPHSWRKTAINLHVHWMGDLADTTAAPRWGLEYAWAGLGQVCPNTAFIYSDGKNYTDTGTDADVTILKHYISKFASITPTGQQATASSVILGRLFRDSANAADTYNVANNRVGLLYIDAHYEIIKMGTFTEY